ncbi:MAG TPA: coenzyme F420-0:L-glutamate ligase [Candidatus Xenobia bacterium]|jgi:hypothetical protein
MKLPWVLMGGMAALVAAEQVLVARKGDADIRVDAKQIRDRRIYQRVPGSAIVEFTVPFVHGPQARQQALLVDCVGRVVPDGDRLRGANLRVWVNNLLLPRDDGYFEAIAVKLKTDCPLQVRVEVDAADGNALDWLKNVGLMRIELNYKFYNRTPIRNGRQEVALELADWLSLTPGTMPTVYGVTKPKVSPPLDARVIPIRTHLLRPEDDFVEIIRRYIKDLAQPGDVVAIAESALAIMQGRVKNVGEIRPRFLARRLNRYFLPDSSLSSCYSCEMAMREIGVGRFVLATLAGLFGRLVGRSGDFYRVAGPDVAAIDDCTGTLAPYDKCVVMGPKNSDEVCRDVKARTGLEAAVVDANDLHKCQVLGISDPTLSQMVHDSLLDNPQGNGGEQTPIVLIRRHPAPKTLTQAAGRG